LTVCRQSNRPAGG